MILISHDGTGLVRLTDFEDHKAYPWWSPDDKSISFVRGSGQRGVGTLWVMIADASDPRQLLDTEVMFSEWSPTKLVSPWGCVLTVRSILGSSTSRAAP